MGRTCFILLIMACRISPAQTMYDVSWAEVVNAVVNADNSLTKIAGAGSWTAGAASLNILKAGEDGFLQWTFPGTGSQYMVSLSGINNDIGYANNDYTLQVSIDGTITIRNANQPIGNFGTVAPGDILRIAREGATIKFYRNANVIYSMGVVGNTANLRVDVTMHTLHGTLPPVTATFDKMMVVRPQFVFPGLNASDGSINVQVDGAYEPVTYLWSTGEQTASISGKPQGAYTLTVTDSHNRSIVRTYSLGYPVFWTRTGNVTINTDNSLSKTGPVDGFNAGASSINMLLPNVDGWIEFVMTKPSPQFRIGLSRVDIDFTQTSINYSWQVARRGGISITEGTSTLGNFGTMLYGDVFRITREAGLIKYYLNGELKRSVTGGAARAYIVDVTIHSNTNPLPVITTSFDQEIRLKAIVTPPGNDGVSGSVALEVLGTYEPSTLQWSSGEHTPTIANKPVGTYTVTVSDAANRTLTRTYEIGHRILWNGLINISENVNSFSKLNNIYAWNAGAISSNYLPASEDGWVEFIVGRSGQQFCMGLSRVNAQPGLESIDYGFFFPGSGNVNIYEAGVNRGVFGNHMEDGVYKVARENGFIRYYINGALVRSITANYSQPLVADVSIYHTWAPTATVSFENSAQAYYAIADGNWTSPSTWSLSESGPAATTFPGANDDVYIKGFKINVTSGISCGEVELTVPNDATGLEMNGVYSELRAAAVRIISENNSNATRALVVQNNGKLNISE